MIEDCAISQIIQHPSVCSMFYFSVLTKRQNWPTTTKHTTSQKQESERDGEREKRERKRENVLLNRAPCTRLTPNWAGSREREKMLQHIHYHTQKSAKFKKKQLKIKRKRSDFSTFNPLLFITIFFSNKNNNLQ